MLGLLGADLVSQLSHAAYLGGELAKADAALRLRLRYEQDRPLKRDDPPPVGDAPAMPAAVSVSLSPDAFDAAATGATVVVALEVTAQPDAHHFVGALAMPTGDDPLRTFRRTTRRVGVRWGASTQIVMGNAMHIQSGALLRVQGVVRPDGEINADLIAVLTKVATIT